MCVCVCVCVCEGSSSIRSCLALHRPAGWDNEKKIAILYENMHTMTPEDYYTDVIVRPPVVRKVRLRPARVGLNGTTRHSYYMCLFS